MLHTSRLVSISIIVRVLECLTDDCTSYPTRSKFKSSRFRLGLLRTVLQLHIYQPSHTETRWLCLSKHSHY